MEKRNDRAMPRRRLVLLVLRGRKSAEGVEHVAILGTLMNLLGVIYDICLGLPSSKPRN